MIYQFERLVRATRRWLSRSFWVARFLGMPETEDTASDAGQKEHAGSAVSSGALKAVISPRIASYLVIALR